MPESERNWKEILLPAYEIRKTKAQKTAFLDLLRGVYGERMRVEESKNGVLCRNVVIGDPDAARVIYTAHYDTCAVLPLPNVVTPKNFFLYLLYQIALSVLLILPVFLAELLANRLLSALGADDFVVFLVTEVLLIGGLTAMIWLLLAGPANRHTANDNTSGVVTVLTLADQLQSTDCAFMLFDNEELGLLGSSAFAKAHPELKKNGCIVNFDCVSDGDTLMILFPQRDKGCERMRKLKDAAGEICGKYGKAADICTTRGVFYPSDQAAFRHGIGVAALKKAKFFGTLYMDRIHTSRDTVFEEDNIAALTELFKTLDEM